MKKHENYLANAIFLFALAAGLSSCNDDDNNPPITKGDPVSFGINMSEPLKKINYGTIGGLPDGTTAINWNQGDSVSIYTFEDGFQQGKYSVQDDDDDNSSALGFTGTGNEIVWGTGTSGTQDFYSFYPRGYGNAMQFDESQYTVRFSIPGYQTVNAGNHWGADNVLLFGKGSGDKSDHSQTVNIEYTAVPTVFAITITGTSKTLSSVEIRANATTPADTTQYQLAGSFRAVGTSIANPIDEFEKFDDIYNESRSVVALNPPVGTTFYVSIAPYDYAAGIEIVLNTTTGESHYLPVNKPIVGGTLYPVTLNITDSESYWHPDDIHLLSWRGAGTYGYAAETRASWNFLKSTSNFGVDGKVYMPHPFTDENRRLVSTDNEASINDITFYLNNTGPIVPEIFIIGYNVRLGWWNGYAAFAKTINDWLAADPYHTLILFCKEPNNGGAAANNQRNFWNLIFGEGRITSLIASNGALGAAGAKRRFPRDDTGFENDPIVTGKGLQQTVAPFGPVAGLYRGIDATSSGGWAIAQAYENEFVIYDYATANGIKYATFFRHKTKRILICADAGFLSAYSETGGATQTHNICPFVTTGPPNYYPAPTHVNWGSGNAGTSANNSLIFANIMNWALGCPQDLTPNNSTP